MEPPKPSSTPSTASSLALNFLEARSALNPQGSSTSLMAQIEHRMALVKFWEIPRGACVLEIGCGQGDTTTALADAVGDEGWVDGVDPGRGDYGSPYTLSQSQAHILASPLGSRIAFHQSLPAKSPSGRTYTHIVLSHSVYYFSSPSVLPSVLHSITPYLSSSSSIPTAKQTSTRLCIAEWSLHASSQAEIPHVLTALLLSFLEGKRKEESSENIRTVLSPKQISSVIEDFGHEDQPEKWSGSGNGEIGEKDPQAKGKGRWVKERESISPTGAGMRDAYWEVRDLLKRRPKDGQGEDVFGVLQKEGVVLGRGEEVVVEAMFDAVEQGVERLEGGMEGVRCMDFWAGRWIWSGHY